MAKACVQRVSFRVYVIYMMTAHLRLMCAFAENGKVGGDSKWAARAR